jgi:O-antigen/teichoic acid export membrane protein
VSDFAKEQGKEEVGISAQVRGAVLWRSGSQLFAQVIMWASTFLVIRILDPRDYGLFAMTQVILVFLNLMNGYGFANSLIRSPAIDKRDVAQAFGMLILLNGGLALAQIILAPAAAAYFRQPVVADLLRVQSVIYLATPFTALQSALLSRRMDFRSQAQVHLTGALIGAATALVGALAGLGVWTLVVAPIAMFWTQAIGMTLAARALTWPSFRFAGAGDMVRYGGAMVLVQFCWFIQSQADVFIAGRVLTPHVLGIYTTALFLTQILSNKFVPTINDITFAAYSRIQDRPDAITSAFLKSIRLISLIAMPFYLGLAAVAEPMVETVLGSKWIDTVPLVQILALAMPFMALQILFAPANNALGRSAMTLRIATIGALLMPIAFAIGIRHGSVGLACSWLAALPVYAIVTALMCRPVIGFSLRELGLALMPGTLAAASMAVAVLFIDGQLPAMAPQARLAILVGAGVAFYFGLLMLFARSLVREVKGLAFNRTVAA